MNNKLDTLVEMLNSIPESNFRECEDEFGLFAFGDIACEADELASDILITDEGRPNYEAIMRLNKLYGFQTRPGEADSFGWLTGVIWFPDNEHCLVFG